jgi:hypothetical protein
MSQTIPTQHPAVVLRSHYVHLRTLLAVALVAVVGLSAAVVILAIDNDAGGTSAGAIVAPAQVPTVPHFDRGRPEEGTRGPFVTTGPARPRFDKGLPGAPGSGH